MPLNSRVYEWCSDSVIDEADSHVFFSPHLDDAALSCGGMIHSLVAQKQISARDHRVRWRREDEAFSVRASSACQVEIELKICLHSAASEDSKGA